MKIIHTIEVKLKHFARLRLARKMWSLLGDISVDGGSDEAFEMRRFLGQWCEKHNITDYYS